MPAQPLPGTDALLHPRRMLVPCDGSEVAFSALALACDIANRTGGQVFAVHVIVVRRSLPIDDPMVAESKRGNEILTRAEEIGKAMGQNVETELLQARDAGNSIIDEAENLAVDAIFLGLELKERIGEPTVGAKIDHLLREAPCQVWIFRDTLANEGVER
ncbi:MAG TPA: universal stress protein [Dehalococcoidia bacterium]|nr:universal stress protein [Dehalococcoidia bacterium]